MAGSHYETLGVAEGADPDAVRRAYLAAARRLHPDRWVDASDAERAEADRRMREVNEAWRVLGNPGRRYAYDAGRRRPFAAASTAAAAAREPFASGSLFDDGEPPPDALTRVIRFLPWALVLAALAGIFVFTAYATSDGSGPVSCVRIEGTTAVSVPCDEPGARGIALRVTDVAQCPADTEPYLPPDAERGLCLEG